MKKIKVVLLFVLLTLGGYAEAQSMTFYDQVKEIIVGKNKYKIAVRYINSNTRIYIPMRKIRNGRVLREWEMSDRVFSTQYKAMEVIRKWKEEEEEERILRRTEYIKLY